MDNQTYIIAEAGVNHNGQEKLAFELIDKIKEAGADAVKFQLFQASHLTTQAAPQADYQIQNTAKKHSQYEMLKSLELSFAVFEKLKRHADECDIDFIVTPFDLESLAFLVDGLALPTLKISSGDVTHGPLLLAAARSQADIILSTGMSTLSEIEQALKVLVLGMIEEQANPTQAMLDTCYALPEAFALLQQRVTLLHCTSEYPAPFEDVNLKAMDTLHAAFGLCVGFSDHTVGIEVPIAAVARGAMVIEKHVTLDKNLPGPDHLASLDIVELKQMVQAIRHVEMAIGDGRKCPRVSEMKNMTMVRRALVANQDIDIGDTFSASNLAVKRHTGGISPMAYWDWLGKTAQKRYSKDEAISE
ncbi:N-acetylneuraminate synthase [Candidatus Berkiella aquae]|uniref:N,N'-diacetyllegionaminic acid synthase n=1 Tax=Candidatus Berkiella aquae TaxID=295108 RepID=A0A0Q9YNT2_9GAMM|nr:N-acetylneuraminate synthase [Candidatus Berkiella aquae]MCS5712335.1 N-acetylneuraminate synthase [Candidatus Berkiella aquae]